MLKWHEASSGTGMTDAVEIVRIERWRMVESSDAAATVQQMGFRLRGNVFGHPGYPDGERITTSEIQRVEGTKIICKSRVYILGEPAKEYMDMLQSLGATFDPQHPLRPFVAVLDK